MALNRYVIERDIPNIGASSGEELAGATSNSALAELAPREQWEHSCVAGDKTFCIRLNLVASIVVLVVVGACGGSGETGTQISLDGGETAANPFNSAGFALAGEEITSEAPKLTVKAGEEVTINFENKHGQYSQTSALHDLVIVPKLDDLELLTAPGAIVDVQTGEVIDHVLWGSAIPRLPSGESASVKFVPDDPGNYYYLCTIPVHARVGMIGEFVVEP